MTSWLSVFGLVGRRYGPWSVGDVVSGRCLAFSMIGGWLVVVGLWLVADW